MSVLLAIGHPDLTSIIRKVLVEADFDVLENDVLHRNYLNEIIEYEKPKMVLIHDVYLPSDLTNSKDKDDEMLRLIQHLRTMYDSGLRIVYVCERDKRDPFLSALVARNVLDIFNERQIVGAALASQLQGEARFANVMKFGVGELEVEFSEEEQETEGTELNDHAMQEHAQDTEDSSIAQKAEQAKQMLSTLTGKAKSAIESGNEWNQQRRREKQNRSPSEPKEEKPKREPREPKPKSSNNRDDFQEYIDMMPIQPEIYARTQVIGTVVVGVAGVKAHLGATHTAMSIAAFLQKRRHSVALIELNDSKDFDRIHALYEGEQQFIHHQAMFEYQGIDHYKHREDMRLGQIMATYEYVVLDFGNIEENAYNEEFLRSHVRALLVSPYEWKQHWTDDFCKQVTGEEYFTFVTPFAGRANVADMQERLPELQIVAFPASPNPYVVKEQENDAIRIIMQGFIKENKRVFSKRTVYIASFASAVLTAMVISAFVLLQ